MNKLIYKLNILVSEIVDTVTSIFHKESHEFKDYDSSDCVTRY